MSHAAHFYPITKSDIPECTFEGESLKKTSKNRSKPAKQLTPFISKDVWWDFTKLHLQGRIPRAKFNMWVRPLECVKVDKRELVLRANDAFSRDHVSVSLSKQIVEGVHEMFAVQSRFRLTMMSTPKASAKKSATRARC